MDTTLFLVKEFHLTISRLNTLDYGYNLNIFTFWELQGEISKSPVPLLVKNHRAYSTFNLDLPLWSEFYGRPDAY